MKYFYLILSFTLLYTCIVNGQDKDEKLLENKKAGESYERFMELAHPTPLNQNKKNEYLIPLSLQNNIPIFLNVNLIDSENESYEMQNESSIAINPLNPENLISSAVDYRDASATWVYVSTDAGKTWKNYNLGRPFPGWLASNDPSVAFDPDGVGYLVYGGFGTQKDSLGISYGENGVFISKSTDGGKNWKLPIPVIAHQGKQTQDSAFEDKYYISVDDSPISPYYKSLYIPWKRMITRDSSTQIVISKSTDKGNTWSQPVNVSNKLTGSTEDTTWGQSFPLAATGPDGTVYVVWNFGPQHGVGFAKSTDGAKTFFVPKIIQKYNIFGVARNISGNDTIQMIRHTLKGKIRAETYPVIVCDTTSGPGRGNLYLTWAGDRVPNIYFSRSADGGDNWSSPVIVHSDTTNDQFWQWLAQDPKTGNLAIMYLDSRGDPQNILVECYVSFSSDGGITWIDRRAADVASDLRRNPFSANAFAGDYCGLAFYDGKIFPSWVDMRNAVSNIFDSDVFSALIKTTTPEPVKNFDAKTIPDSPTQILVSWEPPSGRAFGQHLDTSEYHYSFYKEGNFLKDISSKDTTYQDTQLNPYQRYKYSIAVVAGNDTSIFRSDSAFAGGSRNPASPVIISSKGADDNSVTQKIQLPALREDGITALVNLSKISLYRDSIFIKDIYVSSSDTGKIITIIDTTQERGYYSYYVKAADSNTPPNTSLGSNEINLYTGKVESTLSESFDDSLPKRYRNIGGWGVTGSFYRSSPYSLTESPNGNYRNSATYTYDLYPVVNAGTDVLRLEFWHAAIVHKSDTAYVKSSNDYGKSWKTVAKYNSSNYSPWQDGILNNDDWKPELLSLTATPQDTIIVRFALVSNAIANDDGWYIDDVRIFSLPAGVTDNSFSKSNLKIYPNPANETLFLDSYGNSIASESIELYSIYGSRKNNIKVNKTSNGLALDVSALSPGVYFVKLQDVQGKTGQAVFTVYR